MTYTKTRQSDTKTAIAMGMVLVAVSIGCSADPDEIERTTESEPREATQTHFVQTDMDALTHGQLPETIKLEIFRRGCVEYPVMISTSVAIANGNGDAWDSAPIREILEPLCTTDAPDVLSTVAEAVDAKVWAAWVLGCTRGMSTLLSAENQNKGTPVSDLEVTLSTLKTCTETAEAFGNEFATDVLNQFVDAGTITRTESQPSEVESKTEVTDELDPSGKIKQTADADLERWRTYCQELPGRYEAECRKGIQSGFQEMVSVVLPAYEIREQMRFNRSLNYCDEEDAADPRDPNSMVSAPESFFSCVALSYAQRSAHYKTTGEEI